MTGRTSILPVQHDDDLSRLLVTIARLTLAGGGLAIVGADILLTVQVAGGIVWGNYFGQFTILSVLLVSAAMLVSGLGLAGRDRREPRGWVHMRASAMTALAVAAALHATLLGGLSGASGPVVNALLHVVLPLLALLEWALVASASRTRWATSLAGLGFAVLYLGYTLARGAIVDWYPYDFVDPSGPAGYGGLVQSLAIVLFAFLIIGGAIAAVGMLRDRRVPRT